MREPWFLNGFGIGLILLYVNGLNLRKIEMRKWSHSLLFRLFVNISNVGSLYSVDFLTLN